MLHIEIKAHAVKVKLNVQLELSGANAATQTVKS